MTELLTSQALLAAGIGLGVGGVFLLGMEVGRSPGAQAEGWTTGIATIPSETDGVVTLRSVRTGHHDQFDRTVFEFAGDALPDVQISAVDWPKAACGSGDPIMVEGAAWLAVRFQPAQAHTDTGAPTVTHRRQSPRLSTLRELALTCDFEAEVSWTLGLSAAYPYRTQVLRNPLRLVLDVQHSL